MDDTQVRTAIEAALEAVADRVREHFERLGVSPTEEAFCIAAIRDPAIQALMEDEEASEVMFRDSIDRILDGIPPQQPAESRADYERRCKTAIDAEIERSNKRRQRLERLGA